MSVIGFIPLPGPVTAEPLSFHRKASIPTHVLTRPVGDDLVLVSLESEECCGLDPVGDRVRVDPPMLTRDLEELLRALTTARSLSSCPRVEVRHLGPFGR